MGLGASWGDAYLGQQQKEHYYVRFIYKYPATHQNFPGINPMGLGAPRDDALYITSTKGGFFCEVYISTSCSLPKIVQGLTQWFLVTLGSTLI